MSEFTFEEVLRSVIATHLAKGEDREKIVQALNEAIEEIEDDAGDGA